MKFILLLLAFFVVYNSNAQSNFNQLTYVELDSLYKLEYNEDDLAASLPILKFKQVKALKEFGALDSLYGSFTGDLGLVSMNVGDYGKAELYLVKAKGIIEKNDKTQSENYALTIQNLASLYLTLERYDEAELLFVQCKKINQEILGEEHPKYADGLINLGAFYRIKGRYDEALPLFEKAYEIYLKIHGKESAEFAGVLNQIGLINFYKGNYRNSVEYWLEVKSIRKRILGALHSDYAVSLGNLAVLYGRMGEFNKAEPLYLEAKSVALQTSGAKSIDYGRSLNNLATFYINTGQYGLAEPLLLEAKDILAENLGSKHNSYGRILNNLALVYHNLEQNHKAKQIYLEVNKIFAYNFGEEHPTMAISLTNLALVYIELKNFSEAEKLWLKALAIREKALGKNHSLYASTLISLGGLYLKMNRNEEAKPLFLEASQIYAKSVGKEHPEYSNALNSLGTYYKNNGQLDSAFTYCLASMNANSPEIESNDFDFSKVAGYSYYSTKRAYNSLNMLIEVMEEQYNEFKSKDKLLERYALVKSSMHLNEQFRNDFNSSKDKLRMLKNNNKFVHQGIETAILLEEEKYISEAFSFAEQNKSILLADAIKGQRARVMGDLPDSLAEKESILLQEKSELKKKQASAKVDKERVQINKDLNEFNLKMGEFIKLIKSEYPNYHSLKYENITVKTSEIQSLMKENSLMLEYFLTDTIAFLFKIRKQTITLHRIPINKLKLKSDIKALRKSLSNYAFINQNELKAYELFTQKAHSLYQLLLEKALEGEDVKYLNIITDGELGHLPFEIFLTVTPSQNLTDYKELPYLIRDYTISYNYSATLWKENVNAKNKNNNGKLLACASDYTPVDSVQLFNLRDFNQANLRTHLKPLPAAKEEITALSDLFQGEFLSGNATTESYFKANANKYSILHLAMHGILNNSLPILSSLAFTENLDTVEDNYLQAYEISHLHLNADLVVLSACETGYGQFKQGEGVMSLARSFMYAGVPSLVVSLWQVNDHSTAIIMQYFYNYLSMA